MADEVKGKEKEKETREELYYCNGCIEQIPTHRARVSCHSCTDYHLCANCFIIKQFVDPHVESHSTLLLRQSGIVVPTAPGFTARPAPPALPPRPALAVNTKPSVRQSEIPTANWGALWSILKAPLEKKAKKPSNDNVAGNGQAEMRDESAEPAMSGGNGIAVDEGSSSHPKSVRQHTGPSYLCPEKWESLFERDTAPAPIFIAFMSTIFGHLDPDHTGSLTPEVYSDFLDIQGYEIGSNIWKYAFESDGGEQSKDVADLELGLYYADLKISHTFKIRPKAISPKVSTDEAPTCAAEERIKDSLRFSANMPMLSRQGFIDLGAIECLRDPSKGHKFLLLVIEKYKIWVELGPIPRSVLPENSISKEVLAEKIDSEPENAVPKVFLAEKLVEEEKQEIESEKQNGYVAEELVGSRESLPKNSEERIKHKE